MIELLLLSVLGHPQVATVAQVRGNAESYLGQKIRMCGYLAKQGNEPYLWDVGVYDMKVAVLLRGKWKAKKGRTCVVGRVMRADGKRPGDPQYYSSVITDVPIHPAYYLQAE